MGGYGVLFTFFAVGIVLIVFAPFFAILGYAIFKGKHRNGKRGALYGSAAPLLGGIIGIFPYFAGILFTIPLNTQTNIGLYAPMISIPIGLVVLVGMLIFAKSGSAVTRAR